MRRSEAKRVQPSADAFTPLAKGMTSEFANQNAYDCIQIHGGSGFMKDYACERVYRDARITSIYEGTTQLQVVAAIRHVTTGTYPDGSTGIALWNAFPKIRQRRALPSL